MSRKAATCAKQLTLASYEFQSIHSFRWKFVKNFCNPQLFSFRIFSYDFTVTLILSVPQLQAQELMTSQSWSCTDEYLIPTYSTLVILLHTFSAKNLDCLTSFNNILLINTSNFFQFMRFLKHYCFTG